MCKINHSDVDAIPCALCRACRPELNQPVKIVAAPKPKRERPRIERMVTTVKEEADRRWREWLPLDRADSNKRPTRRHFARLVKAERGMA